MRHHDRRVVLIEKYPVIAGIWRYLISVTPAEIRRIPTVEHVDDLPAWVPQEGRDLFGFCLNAAVTSPRKAMSSGRKKLRSLGRKFEGWSEGRRERVACQVERIRHWKIIEGDYSLAPNIAATWFVDPPYESSGSHYIHSDIDYEKLGIWCRSVRGQVMVCENEGAAWLPFLKFKDAKSSQTRGKAERGPGISKEVVWFGVSE